jgi:outer membrane protein with beta-barrel domain
MKKILLLLVLVSLFNSVWAQDDKKVKASTPSPDFPGALVFEYGLNYLVNNDNSMRTNPYRSATINVYYMYPVQIGKSRFSVSPGIGVGSEKFGFEDPVSFLDSASNTWLKDVVDLPRFANATSVKRTQFIANYVDFPLEFRVHSIKDDHKRSWFLAVGGKIGVNFYAKTKIKYTEDGSNKTYKDKYHFNVNSFRYGLIGRIGYGPINFWYYYSGSQLFRGNTTPNMSNPTMWSFGVSMAAF